MHSTNTPFTNSVTFPLIGVPVISTTILPVNGSWYPFLNSSSSRGSPSTKPGVNTVDITVSDMLFSTSIFTGSVVVLVEVVEVVVAGMVVVTRQGVSTNSTVTKSVIIKG